ncbi:MAG: FG-GAP-like repeat-containing protein, partial [Pirellulaceae bacterium]
MLLRCCLSWTCLWIGLSVAHAAERTVLIDDSFEDFAAGTPDDGGHNVYVARDGTLRTIQRFDLNGDGYLDILFNCTHNTYQMLPPSVGSVSAARAAFTGEIAVEGSQHCVVADLNRDGYDDIVFCPNGIGVHHDRRFVMVAWGSVDGWTAQHVNSPLPMNAASKVDVADLNGDGWLDIAVLGAQRWLPNQPLGRIIRIYWGSASGYQVTRLHDLGVPGAVDLASADFDLDGHRDLVVLRGEGRLSIFWRPAAGTPQPDTTETAHDDSEASCLAAADVTGDGRPDLVIGSRLARLTVVPAGPDRTWQAARPSPAFPATQITISDLDADHKADAVLTQFDQARAAGGEQAGAGQGAQDVVRILWGATNGFSVDRSTRLTIPLAVATAAGDLDGDGHTDLAVAIHQGTDTFAGESQVYFGSGREFVRGASGFRTSGTLHVAIAPARSGRPAQAIFCNSIGGQLDEAVPLHLYWGSAHGFDPQRIWKIPMHSGYEASAADLDADGHTDLVVLNSGHAGEHSHADPTLGANILWGGPQGLEQSSRRTVLHEHFLGTSSTADLNRDGYLDLVLEPFAPEEGSPSEQLFLYYGSAEGFSVKQRVALAVEGYAQEHMLADFNRDHWLDIAV